MYYRWSAVVFWLLSVLLIFLVVPLAYNAWTYFNFDSTYGFLRLKQKAIATGWYLPAYYSHVLVSALILLVGTFQIFTNLSLRIRTLHRVLGRCYAFGIIFFAAPGGLVMSFFIERGPVVLASFVTQTLAWVVTTALAVNFIRKGNRAEHRVWMIRSYAITLAAVTLRLYTFIFSWSFDLSQPEAYEYIAWASWIVNLVIAEIFLKISRVRNIAP